MTLCVSAPNRFPGTRGVQKLPLTKTDGSTLSEISCNHAVAVNVIRALLARIPWKPQWANYDNTTLKG